ncbi:MAG TPA: acyltransferase, partial [Actinomycetes bacterium]|nr:acyltransferase [Actinomycetes bacterium]
MPYLPGLDGIRAIAVMGVLLFHLPAELLPGGFLGVDVFFVLSGFLITSLLLQEVTETRRIAFKAFYLRRARRLLPALFAVLLVTTVLALTVARDAAAQLRHDILAALTYTTNWWYLIDDRSYFDVTGRPPLLQHLWTLAIEEQFYLVWPAVFLFTWRRWGSRGVGWTALGGTLASTVWMSWLAVSQGLPANGDTARLYFGSDTHAMGILLGAALAVVWRPTRLPRSLSPPSQRGVAVVGSLSLLALLGCLTLFSESSPLLYRGGFLLVSAISAVAVAAAAHPAAAFGRALGNAPMQWVGKRSYGIYLWHWPIFLVTRPDLDLPYRGVAAALTSLGLTFAAAEASYRWIEMPVRRGAASRLWHQVASVTGRTWSAWAVSATVVVSVLVAGGAALATVPTVDASTYLGGVTSVGAEPLTDTTQSPEKQSASRKPLWLQPITAVG